MHEQLSIEAAIDSAKVSLPPGFNEPAVPTTCVLFRELIHAVKCLWGYPEHQLREGMDPGAPQALLDALCSGEIISRQYDPAHRPEHCSIIPKTAWTPVHDQGVPDAYHASFWHGVLRYEQDCAGYRGSLPFVLREDAVKWLARKSDGVVGVNLDDHIRELFDKAKGSMSSAPSDPVVPRNYVTVYDIAYAAERLQGVALESIAHGRTAEICERLLSALIEQELIARMLDSDHVVPVTEWSAFRNKGVPARESGFRAPEGDFWLSEDHKLHNSIVVVEAEEAVAWLKQLDLTESPAVVQTYRTEQDLEDWYSKIRLPELKELSHANRPTKAQVQKEIVAKDAIGGGDKRDRARRITAKFDPVSWGQKGRPKKTRT